MSAGNNDIDPKIKKSLSRKYDIDRVIGSGGMAIVYQAIQKTLDRKVALKVVHQNFVHDKEFIDRFTKEARVVASLNHPNIITIHDVDSIDQFHYMTMEHLSGEPLSEKIRKKGKLGISEALKIVVPIAKALNYLHNRGFIHRDVKSSNIFVCEDGRAVLMDFGIVYTSESMLSQPGTVLGTPEFMSPEQANGDDLTGSSDLYSLGVILYECLTASMPFRTDNPLTTVYKVINEAPRSVKELNPKVPEWLNSQILNLLSKDPKDRVTSANEFIRNLRDRKEVDFSFEGLKVFTPTKDSNKDVEALTTRIGATGAGEKSTQATQTQFSPAVAEVNMSLTKTLVAGVLGLILVMVSAYLWLFMGQPAASNPSAGSQNIRWSADNSSPYYPGGKTALDTYLKGEISKLNQEFQPGKVYIRTEIGINGEVTNSSVISGINEKQDLLAKQLVENISLFVSAKQNGENIASSVMMVVEF